MIYSFNSTQTVASGANVLFLTDVVRTKSCLCGGWLNYIPNTGLFTITRGGLYEISFESDVTSTATGAIPFAIMVNGQEITRSTYTVATASVVGHVGNTAVVRVPCGTSLTISISNQSANGVAATNSGIIIKRIA